MYVQLLALLFAAWLVVSIVAQFRGLLTNAIRRHDPFSLVPRWTFFAPLPKVSDDHLLYRDWLGDDRPGEWRELPPAGRRPWLDMVWNPARRRKKVLLDATRGLLGDPYVRRPTVVYTVHYAILLSVVVTAPHAPGAVATQFMLVRSLGAASETGPQPVFRSARHRLA